MKEESINFLAMKRVEAIVRVERLPIVKEHLREIGIGGMTITSVSGWSKQRELHLQWRGLPVSYDLIPRSKFEIIIPDDRLDFVLKTITENARTGEHGDGLIFVSNVEEAINIATLDRGEKAIS
ncbi:MAG TPA: P-II family nitrogen regulator [Candidatus Bathyarchaeia archaeon]|nr:P-II family nitrogen regulator [Candidatus Bathyarchaeia archaeon]